MSIGPWDFGGFDIVVLLLLVISGLMSLGRGFTRELVSIAALVVSIFATLFLYGRFRNAAIDFIQPEKLAVFALIAGSFAFTYMFVILVLRSGTKKLQGQEPGLFDRILGFGFGIFRGLVIIALFFIIWGQVSNNDETPEILENSLFYDALKPITEVMVSLFEPLKESAEDTIDLGRENVPDTGSTPPLNNEDTPERHHQQEN